MLHHFSIGGPFGTLSIFRYSWQDIEICQIRCVGAWQLIPLVPLCTAHFVCPCIWWMCRPVNTFNRMAGPCAHWIYEQIHVQFRCSWKSIADTKMSECAGCYSLTQCPHFRHFSGLLETSEQGYRGKFWLPPSQVNRVKKKETKMAKQLELRHLELFI